MANPNFVKFVNCTVDKFVSLEVKDTNTLYFVEGVLYKGDTVYGGAYEVVDAKPSTETAKQGITYVVKNSGGVYFFDGTAVQTICPPITTEITSSSTNNELASALAVYKLVESVSGGAAALGERVTTLEGEMDTAQADITQLKTDVVAAKQAGDNAQTDVDALEAKIGVVPEESTVVEMIEAAKEEATYDDTELRGKVTANEAAIATLNGNEMAEGSVKKIVADAVAKIIADAPESFDTLKEISDWISTHAEDASAMNSDIAKNKSDIAKLVALVGTLPEGNPAKTIIEYIDSKVAGIDFSEAIATAKQEAITAAAEDATTKANNALSEAKTYADAIDAKVTVLNGADTVEGSVAHTVKAAKEELSATISGVSGRVTTLESDNTTNKANIASNTSEIATLKNTTVPAAIQTAKDYADGLNTAMGTKVTDVETALTWQTL